MKNYMIGVDVGGTSVKLGLYCEPTEWVEKWEIPTRTENGGEKVLPDIAHSIAEVCAKHSISKEQVEGIGIGLPGPVLPDGTVVGCVNLGWGIFNVAEALHTLTGLPVYPANDANIAALGEQWKGAGSKYQNVVLLTLGTGVGGGIILDGHIVTGALGAAGEVGHMPVLGNTADTCNCGKTNCMELAGSASGVARFAEQLLQETDTPSALRSVSPVTAKAVCDCAAEGDALAKQVIAHMADAIGTGIASIGCVLNPEAFLFGGGMSAAGDTVLEPIRQIYREKVFPPSKDTPILQATLGNNAGIYGAVRLVQLAR